MKRKWIATFLTITMLGSMLSGCAKESTGDEVVPIEPETEEAASTAADTTTDYTGASYSPVIDFGYRLFEENSKDTLNPVLSPVSAYIALTMAGNGADGTTLEEFHSLLGKNGEMTELSNALMQKLPADSETLKLTLANSAWLDDEFQADEEWLAKITSLYQAQAYNTNLSTTDAMDAMNKWVSDNTAGLIDKMIEKPMQDDTRLVLFNTLYFKGDWNSPFTHEATYEQPFTLADASTVDTAMMHQYESYFDYLENDALDGVLLPYADSSLAFVALKAKDDTPIRDALASLSEEGLADMIAKKQEGAYMDLTLPKFEITFERTLNDSLQALGLVSAFDADNADFTKLGTTQRGDNLYISLVYQKAKIIVDEEGTEAAAATEIAMAEATALIENQPKDVTFDKPFLYMIMDMDTQVPLFIGILDNPTE